MLQSGFMYPLTKAAFGLSGSTKNVSLTHGEKVELLKANKAHPDRRKGKERAKKAPKGFKKKHTYKDRYKDD